MGEKRKTLEETYPEGPKPGDTYEFGTEKELRCWYDGKWKPAYRVRTLRTDESANELVDWLTGHGITRITFTSQVQPNGASPAVLFHNKVGSTRFELAMAGDLLVDEQGIFGVRVHGYPPSV